jgi:hypothetical protein
MPLPKRRRRPSTIDRLDPEIKDLIGKLRIDFGWTIDEILARLHELGQSDIKRSALGVHIQSIEETGAQLRLARETATALVSAAGEGQEDRVAELNIELCQAMILRLMTAVNSDGDGKPVLIPAAEINLITKSLQQAASAKKTNADLIFRLRKEAREEAMRDAAKAVDALAKEKTAGLTKDTVDLIKRRIMGIAG